MGQQELPVINRTLFGASKIHLQPMQFQHCLLDQHINYIQGFSSHLNETIAVRGVRFTMYTKSGTQFLSKKWKNGTTNYFFRKHGLSPFTLTEENRNQIDSVRPLFDQSISCHLLHSGPKCLIDQHFIKAMFWESSSVNKHQRPRLNFSLCYWFFI